MREKSGQPGWCNRQVFFPLDKRGAKPTLPAPFSRPAPGNGFEFLRMTSASFITPRPDVRACRLALLGKPVPPEQGFGMIVWMGFAFGP